MTKFHLSYLFSYKEGKQGFPLKNDLIYLNHSYKMLLKYGFFPSKTIPKIEICLKRQIDISVIVLER